MSYKIKGISLLVTDVKRSLEFYNGILGMQINQKTEDRIEFAYKGGESINITLGKNTPENESKSDSSNGNIMITFMITNFDELHNVLLTNNIKFYRKVNEGPYGKNVIVEDPDGYLISLNEPKPTEEFSQIPYYHGFAPEWWNFFKNSKAITLIFIYIIEKN